MPDGPVVSNTSPLFYLYRVGQLGVLLKAKEEGHLSEVVPWIHRLRASGMYVSDSLETRVAKLAGESA